MFNDGGIFVQIARKLINNRALHANDRVELNFFFVGEKMQILLVENF
jgi:hypothetical protein